MSQVNHYVEVPQETKYKLVAPDGGWGYLVVLAFIVYSVSNLDYYKTGTGKFFIMIRKLCS